VFILQKQQYLNRHSHLKLLKITLKYLKTPQKHQKKPQNTSKTLQNPSKTPKIHPKHRFDLKGTIDLSTSSVRDIPNTPEFEVISL
jgi:hypothetical protein